MSEVQLKIEKLESDKKAIQGTPCEVYARIVGYYRAVKNWNAGKSQEYKERVNFEVKA
jgi:ribonucleoside-triphosphate reductase